MLFESRIHAETSDFFAHNTCRLVIFMQPLRIYFVLLGANEELVYCKEYINQNGSVDILFLRYAFEQENTLNHSYSSIKVYLDTEFCLIPDFPKYLSHRYDFARFMLDEDVSKEEIFYHPLTDSEIGGIFIPPQLWLDLLNEYLPAYELASGSDLLYRLGTILHNSLKPLLLIQILDKHINLLGLKLDKLAFIHRFPYRTGLDLVYFIQLSANILQKGGKVDLFVVGEIEEEDANWQDIKKYFPKIRFPLSLKHRSKKSQVEYPWWKYTYLS